MREVLFWTLFSQAVRFATAPLTAAAIVTWLSDVSQGYFYTILSLVGLQVVLELGFGQTVLQMAAYSFAGDGKFLRSRRRLTEEESQSIRPVVVFALRVYSIMGVLFAVIVGVIGYQILAAKGAEAADTPQWQVGWLLAVVGTSLSFPLLAVTSILEGLQQLGSVLRARALAGLISAAATVGGLAAGLGITVVGITATVTPVITAGILGLQWSPICKQLAAARVEGNAAAWRSVAYFQGKMTVNAVCAYFYWSVAVPALFVMSGPVPAGQYALTWAAFRSVNGVSNLWTYSHIGRLGQLVSQGRREQALQLWWSRFLVGSGVGAVLSILVIIGIPLLESAWPQLVGRFGDSSLQWLLALCNLAQNGILMSSHLMHAHRTDGFVWMTVGTTLLIAGLGLVLVPAYGVHGAAIATLLPTLISGCFAPTLLRVTLDSYWSRRS